MGHIPNYGIWSVIVISNITLADLQLLGTSPNRTYIEVKRVSSADPNRNRRDRTSSVHDPRKPRIDKDRARLAQTFLGRKDNNIYASESHCPNLDFKLDVQLSPWDTIILGSPFIFPELCNLLLGYYVFLFLHLLICVGRTYHPTTF